MKPYYDEAGITIYHGDALEVLTEVRAGIDVGLSRRLDLLLADPPYNVGCGYDVYDDRIPSNVYGVWCGHWMTLAREVTQRQVVFPGHGNLPVWWRRSAFPNPSGVGCWYKPGNPAGGGVFQFCEWEPYLLFGQAKGLPDVITATINASDGGGGVGHPCPKPLRLFAQILARSKAASVIDPFLGSGTSLRAAKTLGIPAIGIEISEAYCEIAAKRLAQEVLDFGAAS